MQARRGPAFRGRAPSFSPCWIGGGRGRLLSLPAKGRPQRKRAIGACLARSWTPTPLRRPLGAGFCRSPSLVGRGAVRCRREGGSAPAPVWGGWLLGRRPKNALRLREVGREAVRFPRVAVPPLDQARGLRGQVRRRARGRSWSRRRRYRRLGDRRRGHDRAPHQEATGPAPDARHLAAVSPVRNGSGNGAARPRRSPSAARP